MLVCYGFCFPNNKCDSVTFRIRRSLPVEVKLNKTLLSRALLLTSEEAKADVSSEESLTKKIHLKATRLDNTMLGYLRAHCLIMYQGPNLEQLKVTQPCDLDYELMVLDVYSRILEHLRADCPERFEPVSDHDIEASAAHRKHFIKVYRNEQVKIFQHQLSLIETVKSVLTRVKMLDLSHTFVINQVCC